MGYGGRTCCDNCFPSVEAEVRKREERVRGWERIELLKGTTKVGSHKDGNKYHTQVTVKSAASP